MADTVGIRVPQPLGLPGSGEFARIIANGQVGCSVASKLFVFHAQLVTDLVHNTAEVIVTSTQMYKIPLPVRAVGCMA
jgi:hypothetical protein